MNARASLFSELKRRNVLRAGVLYAGAVWALAQGIAQLGPFFAAPEWTVRWFVIAGAERGSSAALPVPATTAGQ
jgi:hypothetical protein